MLESAPPVFRGEISVEAVLSLVEKLVNDDNNDSAIYNQMHRFVHGERCACLHKSDSASTSPSTSSPSPLSNPISLPDASASLYSPQIIIKRGMNRARELKSALPAHLQVSSLLDIGCADCSISAALGDVLRVPKNRIYGCDVRPSNNNMPCRYYQVLPGASLPFHSQSLDLVSAVMVLHHVRDLDRLLREIRRILKGVSIIREHDVETSEYTMALDLHHGLCDLVWPEPRSDPNFLENHFAHYRSRSSWRSILESHGFIISNINERSFTKTGKFNSFLAVCSLDSAPAIPSIPTALSTLKRARSESDLLEPESKRNRREDQPAILL